MSTTTTDALAATGMIMAAYAGNPTPSLKPNELLDLIDSVHAKLSGFAGGVATEARDEIMTEAARQSLVGSSVTVDAFDPERAWPDQTPEVRAKFMRLIEEHDILIGADGFPQTRKPRDKLVTPDLVFDPISGAGMKMLKRHLKTAYDLDEPELRAFFRLGSEYVITAPKYSAKKAKQAAKQGLGRYNKKKDDAIASREAAAAAPASTAKPRSKTASTTAKAAQPATAKARSATRATKASVGKAATTTAKATGRPTGRGGSKTTARKSSKTTVNA